MRKAPNLAGYSASVTKQLGAHSFVGVQVYVLEMYFEDPRGCVPAKYIGEDLMENIHTKFYYPLAFLDWLFLKKHPKLKKDTLLITIDPSYESGTNYVVHLYEQKVALLQGSWNAWRFWFENEAEFEDLGGRPV